jgi:hypothetical protein
LSLAPLRKSIVSRNDLLFVSVLADKLRAIWSAAASLATIGPAECATSQRIASTAG